MFGLIKKFIDKRREDKKREMDFKDLCDFREKASKMSLEELQNAYNKYVVLSDANPNDSYLGIKVSMLRAYMLEKYEVRKD